MVNWFTKLDDNGKKRLNLTRILVLSVFLVMVLWSFTFILFLYQPADNAGVIGDTFGMVNALFSALAFAFLIYTSLLQTEELKLQREELRESRKQYEEMAEAQKLQAEILRSQFDFEKDLQLNQFAPNLKLEFDTIKIEVNGHTASAASAITRVYFIVTTDNLPAFVNSVVLLDANQVAIENKVLEYDIVQGENRKIYFEIGGYPSNQLYLKILYEDVKRYNYVQTVKFQMNRKNNKQYDSIVVLAEKRLS